MKYVTNSPEVNIALDETRAVFASAENMDATDERAAMAMLELFATCACYIAEHIADAIDRGTRTLSASIADHASATAARR